MSDYDSKKRTPVMGFFIGKVVLPLITIVVVAAIFIVWQAFKAEEPTPEPEPLITSSLLEEVIIKSELSTFQAIYIGVANVQNKEDPAIIDYYVYYEATVKAGINLENVSFDIDDEHKKITIKLPNVEITDVNVDIATLDYIFEDDDANTGTVSEQAYQACIADVKAESSQEDKIFELAEENARNYIEALIAPFVEQLDAEYTLQIL